MISLEQLGKEFGRNTGLIEMQKKGPSHADSLVQPEAHGNSMD